MPPQPSPRFGPDGVRARVGFKPKRPQHDAGMRIEPPPSVACASGIIPAATAAEAPPLEPPAMRSRFQGLRVLPKRRDSDVVVAPSSGEWVLPKIVKPAALIRST